jgi:hypothetical protein
LIDTILGDLLIGASPAELAIIDHLRKAGIQQTQKSTSHVQAWTAVRTMQDWGAFCSDSAAMQADIQLQIRTEQLMIRRMLQQKAFSAGQPDD